MPYLVAQKSWAATAVYVDGANVPSNFGSLSISTSEALPDKQQMFALGYMEAAMTHTQIFQEASGCGCHQAAFVGRGVTVHPTVARRAPSLPPLSPCSLPRPGGAHMPRRAQQHPAAQQNSRRRARMP